MYLQLLIKIETFSCLVGRLPSLGSGCGFFKQVVLQKRELPVFFLIIRVWQQTARGPLDSYSWANIHMSSYTFWPSDGEKLCSFDEVTDSCDWEHYALVRLQPFWSSERVILLHPFGKQKLGLIYAAPPLIVAMLGLLVGIPILIIYCVGRCCCNKCNCRLRHRFPVAYFLKIPQTKLAVLLIWWTSWTLNAAYEENGERQSVSSLKMAWFSASSFVSLWLVLCMQHSPPSSLLQSI